MRPPWTDPLRQTACRGDGRRNQGEGRRAAPGGRLPQTVRGFGGMSARRVQAITQRLLHQFRRDRRTLALLFGAPLVILALLGYLLRGGGDVPKMGVVNLDSGPLGSIASSPRRCTSREASRGSRRASYRRSVNRSSPSPARPAGFSSHHGSPSFMVGRPSTPWTISARPSSALR